MGSFANSAFSIILGWIRSAVSGLWQMVFAAEDSSFMTWLGDHWLGLVVALCIVCTLVDMVIHLIRWRPLTVWASFFRRLAGKDEEPVPVAAESYAHKAAVRREWYYPDGTARTEEVYMPEEEAYQQQPEWVQETAYTGLHSSAAGLSDHYVRSFARPDAEVHPGVANKPLEYEDYPVAPETGMDHALLQPPEETIAEETVPELPAEPQPEVVSRSRRVMQRMARLPKNFGMADDDDELQLRYQPAPPAVDKEQAYYAPVYPPSWKPPAGAGMTHGQEEQL